MEAYPAAVYCVAAWPAHRSATQRFQKDMPSGCARDLSQTDNNPPPPLQHSVWLAAQFPKGPVPILGAKHADAHPVACKREDYVAQKRHQREPNGLLGTSDKTIHPR